MIKFSTTAPVDRDVQVSVTLTLKESELRAQRARCGLAAWLAQKFSDAIELGDGANPYPAFEATFGE